VISTGIAAGRAPERVLYWENEGFMVLDSQVPEDPAELDRDALTVVCSTACLTSTRPLPRGWTSLVTVAGWLVTGRAHGGARGWRTET
jgi:hypothetical protein